MTKPENADEGFDCSSAREYRIVTIADAFEQIPPDKIDAFLADLGGMMMYHKRIEKALSQLGKSEIKTNLQEGFVWIDGGKHDLKFMVSPTTQGKRGRAMKG